MKRHLTLSIGIGALLVVRVALAQEVQIGYQGLPYKASGETQNGIQVSDGVLMHVGAGAEGGYDSNVFYQNTNTIGSGLVRVTAFGELTNATRTGMVPSGLSFDARAGLQYRRYMGTDTALDNYRNAFMPSAGLSLGTSASATVGLAFSDNFLRMEDPPYNPGQAQIIRDNNQAAADVRWAPGGGRINVDFRYTNMVDIFEVNTYSYADSLTQELMLDGAWKWLPKTAIFAQARQGYISYLNNPPTMVGGAAPPKYSSFPLHLVAGLRGLVTEKLAALVALGYTNSFYSCTFNAVTTTNCVSTSGVLGSTYANLELTYRPTVLARVVLGYRHDNQNSVISTFYYTETVYASYVQQVGGRAALDLSGRYENRNYQGYLNPTNNTTPATRVDNFFMVGATLDYFLRDWAYAGIGYALVANQSDYTLNAGPNGSVNYVKNQVFARLGVTY